MCGILGGWLLDPQASFVTDISAAMHALKHRGPDAQHYEIFNAQKKGQILFGHTRLSIIDLSLAGQQPMQTSDGRYTIVFNGEIYNYRELRHQLHQMGYHFHSNSDTEVLLTAWQEWGSSCLQHLLGMFTFVIYDKQAQTLTSVRDAFGIKPFFYTNAPGRFLFASEQRALLTLNGKKPTINWQRSYDYLVHGDYDSQDQTFFQDVWHLLPGQMMVFDLTTATLSTPVSWWTPNTTERSDLTFSDATELLRKQFLQNIRLHLRSDVPLGAALSGGIDSSAVVCAMRYIEPEIPIHTFSYIAQGSDVSEEHWIDCVNDHIHAVPHKLIATAEELTYDLDDMILAQGEPFGSTSIYAQYRVYKLAKESGITVTLDGQGADELLAGYHGYPGERLLSLLEQRNLLSTLKFASNWGRWPGRSYKKAWMHLGSILLPDSIYNQTLRFVGINSSPNWLNIKLLKDAGVSLREIRIHKDPNNKGRRVVEKLASSLQQKGLSELLRHGDRDSMRFSVESRVPFLTLPMADLLLSLPENYLISNSGETKSVFRAAMRGIVPDEILDRRDKIGFATPEKDWLLSIAPTARNWLQDSENVPFLNRDALLANFDAVVKGKAPFGLHVWRWINFVRWHQQLNIT